MRGEVQPCVGFSPFAFSFHFMSNALTIDNLLHRRLLVLFASPTMLRKLDGVIANFERCGMRLLVRDTPMFIGKLSYIVPKRS